MLKAGLIAGGMLLILGSIGAVIFPILCVPCVALLAGAGAGYLAGQFERPLTAGAAAQKGAGAGAIGGVGAVVAHLVGGVFNGVAVGPEGGAEVLRQLGLETGPASSDPVGFWIGTLGFACCFGIFEVILMAALGALGGFVWYQMTGNKSAPAAPAM